jgi:hypothetical protein
VTSGVKRWLPLQAYARTRLERAGELDVPPESVQCVLKLLKLGDSGYFRFAAKRRGAEVTALDIQDPDITVFNAVKEIKNSSATYVRCSVYDALPEAQGKYRPRR